MTATPEAEALAPTAAPRPRRSTGLDLFKALLVVAMVATHVIQLLGMMLPGWTGWFAETTNLMAFSGFLLAMGVGVGHSPRGPASLDRKLRPIVLLVLAAWTSSLAFATLVDRLPVTATLAVDVLSFRRLFGWSEFLASFAMLYLLLALFRPQFVALAGRPLLLVAAGMACLASTLVVADQGWPLSATLVGTTRFASFPILPYLPWFLLGVAIGGDGGLPRLWHLLAGLAGTVAFMLSWWVSGHPPARFPPSAAWIVGAGLPLLGLLLLSGRLAGWLALPGWLTLPGRHVLSYLVASNLAIFLIRNLVGRPVRDVTTWLALSGAIILAIGLFWWLLEQRRARQRT